MVLIQKSNWVFRATAVVLVVTGMAAVLCISAVQLDLLETPVALTARWTNDYQSLLNREAQSLPVVDANAADAPGGAHHHFTCMHMIITCASASLFPVLILK